MSSRLGGPTSITTKTATANQAATAADVKAGVSVYDQNGGVVGKVDSVSSKGAVVNTGKVKAAIPVSSFAKNDKGLVIAGDITLAVADVDLVYVGLRAVIASVATAREKGVLPEMGSAL